MPWQDDPVVSQEAPAGGSWQDDPVIGGLPGRPTAAGAAKDKEIRQGLRTAGATFVSNMLSIPHATGELLADAAAVPGTLAGAGVAALSGDPIKFVERWRESRAKQRDMLPASALLALPDPTAEDVLAVPGAFSGAASRVSDNARRASALLRDPNANVGPVKDPRIGTTFAESLMRERERSAEAPISTAAGRAAGDVATMLALRPGERATNAVGLNPRAAEGSSFASYLTRGLARATEAGIDGATIAALGDADPATSGLYTAGIQAGGSAALAAKGWVFKNPIKSAIGLYLGHEMWKSIAPGPQDFFGSKDAAVNEMVGAYIAGTAAGMLGAGRGVGEGNLRRITDAMSSVSRGTVASVVTQLQEASKSGDETPAKVLELMAADPNHFGPDARVRLERAANSDKPRALLDEIDSLMGSVRFRRALEEPQAEQ